MVAGPPCTFFSRWNQTPNNFLVIDKVTCYNSFQDYYVYKELFVRTNSASNLLATVEKADQVDFFCTIALIHLRGFMKIEMIAMYHITSGVNFCRESAVISC